MAIDFTKKSTTAAQAAAAVLARKQVLNAAFTSAVQALNATWPDAEVATMATQSTEARQWAAATAAQYAVPPTPFLTQLWTIRASLGSTETFAALVARTITAADTYAAALARLVAIRQIASANIDAATDPTSVTWSF